MTPQDFKIPTPEEATAYLQSLEQTENSLSIGDSSENDILHRNKKIIKYADDMILERLKHQDGSLRVTDVISAKAEAFKENRLIEGKDDSGPQLIPSVINVQIINN